MSKDTKNETNQTAAQRQVVINAQYIKDLSFENPGAPETLINKGKTPQIDVSVDVQVKQIEEKSYEVSLIIGAKAQIEEKSLFVTELSYGGIFTVDVPESEKQPVLMIYCPGLLFPYARRIISDATRDGGFPPLMLDPIDFANLFAQHQKQSQKSES